MCRKSERIHRKRTHAHTHAQRATNEKNRVCWYVGVILGEDLLHDSQRMPFSCSAAAAAVGSHRGVCVECEFHTGASLIRCGRHTNNSFNRIGAKAPQLQLCQHTLIYIQHSTHTHTHSFQRPPPHLHNLLKMNQEFLCVGFS